MEKRDRRSVAKDMSNVNEYIPIAYFRLTHIPWQLMLSCIRKITSRPASKFVNCRNFKKNHKKTNEPLLLFFFFNCKEFFDRN